MSAPETAYPFDDPALRGFAFERELRGGGMSRLFVAIDRQFDRRVVIKVLVPTEERGLSADRFRREIAVATALQHPNIVPILSAAELGGTPTTPFLVMPYVEGESLRERLLRGPLSIREALHIARDIARALGFAHARGIVHRDIKPGNVLLASGAAMVSDFGVAKALTSSRQAGRAAGREGDNRFRSAHMSLTAIGTSLGTPAYMAPEQAAADPNIDHRADIYALGIVIYEMLVGRPPFHGRSPQELLRAQLADPPPPIGGQRYDVPAKLAALVEQCLEKDPLRRPSPAEEVLRRLDDPAIQSGAFAAPPPNARYWRRRALMWGAPLLVIVALAVAVWSSESDDDAAAAAAQPTPTYAQWRRRLVLGDITAVDGDARTRALITGMRSELLNAVVRVPGLRVGTQAAAPAASDSAANANAANAAPVNDDPVLRLEGTVQRERAQYRVLLRAVDARADSVVWSAAFDGHADSLLALQGRVADAVASALAFMSQTNRSP